MFLIGLILVTPLIALLCGVCYVGYAAVRSLNLLGILVAVLFCAPAGYGLIRLIAEIGKLDYKESCFKLFDAVEVLAQTTRASEEKISAVQYVLNHLGDK